MVKLYAEETYVELITIFLNSSILTCSGAGLLTTGSKAMSKCFLRGMGTKEFLDIKYIHLEYIETFFDEDDDIENCRFDVNGNLAVRDNQDTVSRIPTQASDDNHVFEENFLNIYDFDSDSINEDDDDRGENEEVSRAFQAASHPKRGDVQLNLNSPIFVPRQPHFVPRSVQRVLDRQAQRQEVSLDQTDPAIPEGYDSERRDQEEAWLNDLDRSEQARRAKRESFEKYYWQLPEVVARGKASLNENVKRGTSPEKYRLESRFQRSSSETQQQQNNIGKKNISLS